MDDRRLAVISAALRDWGETDAIAMVRLTDRLRADLRRALG